MATAFMGYTNYNSPKLYTYNTYNNNNNNNLFIFNRLKNYNNNLNGINTIYQKKYIHHHVNTRKDITSPEDIFKELEIKLDNY